MDDPADDDHGVRPPTDPSGPADERFRCPGCQEELDVQAELLGQLVRCPYCSSDFFAADGHTHAHVVDDTPVPAEEPPDAADLDTARIRQLSALRLAALRNRSWWLIGLLLAAVTALDLLGKTVVGVWDDRGWGWQPTLMTAATAVAVWFCVVAAGAARRLGREAAQSTLAEPAEPPDFTGLANGHERWRHLEDVR